MSRLAHIVVPGSPRTCGGVIEIAVDDESVLMDIDTREDLARALGMA